MAAMIQFAQDKIAQKILKKLNASVAVTIFLIFLFGLPAYAQPSGSCVDVETAAVAARYSGMDLRALPSASGGRGLYITSIALPANISYTAKISTTAILDANLATISQNFKFGNGVVGTVVREGTAPTNGTEGSYFLIYGNLPNLPSTFIPPGSYVTIVGTTTDTPTIIVVCYVEVQ